MVVERGLWLLCLLLQASVSFCPHSVPIPASFPATFHFPCFFLHLSRLLSISLSFHVFRPFCALGVSLFSHRWILACFLLLANAIRLPVNVVSSPTALLTSLALHYLHSDWWITVTSCLPPGNRTPTLTGGW